MIDKASVGFIALDLVLREERMKLNWLMLIVSHVNEYS